MIEPWLKSVETNWILARGGQEVFWQLWQLSATRRRRANVLDKATLPVHCTPKATTHTHTYTQTKPKGRGRESASMFCRIIHINYAIYTQRMLSLEWTQHNANAVPQGTGWRGPGVQGCKGAGCGAAKNLLRYMCNKLSTLLSQQIFMQRQQKGCSLHCVDDCAAWSRRREREWTTQKWATLANLMGVELHNCGRFQTHSVSIRKWIELPEFWGCAARKSIY